jgi:hypothetical protein
MIISILSSDLYVFNTILSYSAAGNGFFLLYKNFQTPHKSPGIF